MLHTGHLSAVFGIAATTGALATIGLVGLDAAIINVAAGVAQQNGMPMTGLMQSWSDYATHLPQIAANLASHFGSLTAPYAVYSAKVAATIAAIPTIVCGVAAVKYGRRHPTNLFS